MAVSVSASVVPSGVVAVASVEDKGVLLGLVALGTSLVVIEGGVAVVAVVAVRVTIAVSVVAVIARIVAVATVEDSIFLGLVVLTSLVVVESGVAIAISGVAIAISVAIAVRVAVSVVAMVGRVVAVTTIEDGILFGLVILGLVVLEGGVAIAIAVVSVAVAVVEASIRVADSISIAGMAIVAVAAVVEGVLIGLVVGFRDGGLFGSDESGSDSSKNELLHEIFWVGLFFIIII